MATKTVKKTEASEDAKDEKVSFRILFRYASKKDIFYMIFGTIAAIADGTSMPLFALFFGSIPNTFITGTGNEIVHSAGQIALKFIYLGIASFICAYFGFVCWMIVGEVQSIEIRKRYFKSLLQQDIGFYDSINPNEISAKISEECFNIQSGIGEKVPDFFYAIALFVSGLIIGYAKGWQLALVLTAAMPIIVLSGVLYVFAVQKMARINNECYAKAGECLKKS